MTRKEFERLPLNDQISIFLDSDLWNFSVCDDWEIIHTDEIPDRIEDGVIDTLREYGVADLYHSLDRVVNAIDGWYDGFMYWNRYDEWWDDMAPLTQQRLSDIIDEYSDDEYYESFFEEESPEEEDLSFEGIEELIA